MGTNWESKFPVVSVQALERIEGLSDHASILMTTGLPGTLSSHHFKFELERLHREGFHEMVKRFGKDMLLVIFQFKGGIIKYVLHANTLLVGLVTQSGYLEKRRNNFRLL
jgi:hypothetical protein